MKRYQVRSITGYTITGTLAANQKLGTTWWVADTDNRCLEVPLWKENFDRKRDKAYPSPVSSKLTYVQSIAVYTAYRLNAENEEWERAS